VLTAGMAIAPAADNPCGRDPMFAKLALIFVAIPLIELALLVWIGSILGFWATMALVIVTGLAGALLARLAGVHVILQIKREITAGRAPVGHMVDGLLVLIGGIVLLTPGLLTDLAGFALLVPWSRRIARRAVQRRIQRMVEDRRVEILGGRAIEMDFEDR
jgi:UPF0716 protein FxsA